MELKAVWSMFWRRWWLVLLPVLVVGALTAPELLDAVSGGSPAAGGSWTTVINFTAAQPPSGQELGYEDAGYFPWLASEYVVNGLADWVTTGSFTAEVSAALGEAGLAIDAGALRPAFAPDNARSILRLQISWPDADQLQAIAEAAVDVLQTRSGVYFPQFAAQPAEVIALDSIALAPVPPPLTNRFMPFVKLALGLAVGLGLALLVEYLDDSIRTRADLEALALPVLGQIPRR